MKILKLVSGEDVYVDDDDYEWLNANNWWKEPQPRTIYARRQIRVEGRLKWLKMHREIVAKAIGAPIQPGMEIDHKDHNGLNNQKENLRLTPKHGNCKNKQKQLSECSSTYKGVSWRKKHKRWQVFIHINGKNKFLGQFDDETDAAEAYNEAATLYYGEFAYLNKIIHDG